MRPAARRPGLEGVILSPADTDEPELPSATYGASVFTVRGTFEDCRRLERELEHLFPWGFLEGNLHAFAVEGIKTIAYEIAEQLGWETPDAVVSPVASGTLFAKIAQGFVELADLGLVVDGPPRMYGAQPGGCPPVAAAWADERPPSRVTPNTVARSLAVGDPSYGELAIGAARMSGGSITALPEELIESSTELLAENSGVLADPAGGVAFGTLVELVRSGEIASGERVVLVVTRQRHQAEQPRFAVPGPPDRGGRRRLPDGPRRRPRLVRLAGAGAGRAARGTGNEPVRAELSHLADDRQERPALLGQLVLDAGRRLRIAVPGDDAGLLERPQTVGERSRAHSLADAFELSETARSAAELVDEQRCPFRSDDLAGGRDRAARKVDVLELLCLHRSVASM